MWASCKSGYEFTLDNMEQGLLEQFRKFYHFIFPLGNKWRGQWIKDF